MKPCFVTTAFYPGQQNSGISNALYLLTKYLYEKKGVRSTVFAPEEIWGTKDEEKEFVSIRRFKTHKLMNYSFSSSVGAMLDQAQRTERFDFVHSYHFGFYPATAGCNFALRHGLPHFLVAAFHPPSSGIKKSMMDVYNYTQGRRVLSSSAMVFPFNENEKKQLSGYSPGKYSIIPCPVNDKIFHPRGTKTGKVVTYLGTLLPWKGSQIALDIFKKISEKRSDIKFNIVGRGPLETYLRKSTTKNIKVVTNLDSHGVAKILSSSDVVVCPTKYESFGSAIAEAMMCGTPVVTTKVGAVPETVGPGGLLVDYGDWTKMQEYVENLVDDDGLRKKLAVKGLRHSEKYKYANVGKSIYSHYKKSGSVK